MKIFNITWIIIYFEIILAREEWVDPHDMNIKLNQALKMASGYGQDECDKFYKYKDSLYLKKVLAYIINLAQFDMNSDDYKSQIDIQLSTDDYDFLKKFVNSDDMDDISLRRLDKVLDNSLHQSTFDTVALKMSEYIYLAFFNEHTAIFFGLLFLFFILWKIQPHKYTLLSLFKLFLPLVYISDFVLRYQALIEEVEIDKYLEFKKQNCDRSKLGWLDWFYDKFTRSCEQNEKKFLLSQRTAIHIITPMKVLSEQFDIIVPILKYTGEGFGKFMWALIEDVPWYVKPFVAILAFILVIILILMLGSYMFGIYPRFNIFYLLQLEFLHKEHCVLNGNNQQDSVSGDNLRLLLESRINNPDGNRNLGPNRSKHANSLGYKTKKFKEPLRRKLPKLENADLKLKQIESGQVKNEMSVNECSSSSSSSGITVD